MTVFQKQWRITRRLSIVTTRKLLPGDMPRSKAIAVSNQRKLGINPSRIGKAHGSTDFFEIRPLHWGKICWHGSIPRSEYIEITVIFNF